MKTFNQLRQYANSLLEELTAAQKREVDSWGGNKAATDISKDVFAPGEDRKHIPLEHSGESVEPHPLVKDQLEKNGYSVKDYKAGIAQDKHGRDVKIGKALERTKADDTTKKAFTNDPIRSASTNDDNLKVIISKHPHDVAGMSTDRGWTSCMNMKGGCNQHHLRDDVENGTHVAYLVHKHDDEIKRPLARIALKPFKGENGHTVIRPENTTYGGGNDAFTQTVRNFAEKNYPLKDTIYKKNDEVYNDSSTAGEHLINDKKLSSEDINGVLKNSKDVGAIEKVISHPNATSENITKGLQHPNPNVRRAAIRNPNATKEHLDMAMDDKENNVVTAALKTHKDVSTAHITKGLQHWNPFVRGEAARHPNANSAQISQGLNDDSSMVRELAITNPNAKPKHITTAMNMDDAHVRVSAMQHPNATKEHFEQGLNDKSALVRETAARHTPHEEHIDKALNDENQNVREGAAGNTHANEKQLLKATKDANFYAARAAVMNPSATSKVFDAGMNHTNPLIRSQTLHHPNITEKHIRQGMTDTDNEVALKAFHVGRNRGVV